MSVHACRHCTCAGRREAAGFEIEWALGASDELASTPALPTVAQPAPGSPVSQRAVSSLGPGSTTRSQCALLWARVLADCRLWFSVHPSRTGRRRRRCHCRHWWRPKLPTPARGQADQICYATDMRVLESLGRMGVAALACQKAWEEDDARTKATPERPPTFRVPCGPRGVCHVNQQFLPDTVLPRKDWEQLKAECAVRGVSEYHLQCLFLQLCDFRDQASLGTVPVKVFLGMFQTHFSKLLRRLVRLQAGGRRPRLLFEEAVRLILDIASMDYFTLLVVSARVIGGSEVIDADGVRAIVRYISSDRVDAFSKALCKKLVCRDGVPHTLPAFVELGVRYPGLFFPVMQMQRAIQRRFLGMQFWNDFHRRNHTLIQPADFSYSGAKAVTARQVILELLSSGSRPLVMGSQATRALVPAWDAGAFPAGDMLPSSDSGRSSDPGMHSISRKWSDLPELQDALPNAPLGEEPPRETPESSAFALSMGIGARRAIEDTIHEESDESEGSSDDDGVHGRSGGVAETETAGQPSGELAVAVAMERAQSSRQPTRAGLGGTRERATQVLDLSANATALEPHTGAFTLAERVNATRRTLEHAQITDVAKRSAPGSARISSDTANKTVGFLFAAAARGSAKREIRRDVPLSVPMPIAPSITDWARSHPAPAGASLEDGPIDIARTVMLNFASGVGSSIRRVNAPCLFCARNIGEIAARERSQSRALVPTSNRQAISAAAEPLPQQRSRTTSASSRASRVHPAPSVVSVASEPRPAHATHNSGFCSECEEYARKVLVDTYGYHFAGLVIEACAMSADPSIASTSLAEATNARERQPILPVQGGLEPFVFREDIFVEQFDDNTGQMFYYNVATGDSTWRRPVRYVPLSLSAGPDGAAAGKE